jgi:hypothetical protein
MDIKEIRDSGHHLAIIVAFRMLAHRMAELVSKDDIEGWFTEISQQAFDYVDRTKHPTHDENTLRAVKESAYDTLRMIFDAKGFENKQG